MQLELTTVTGTDRCVVDESVVEVFQVWQVGDDIQLAVRLVTDGVPTQVQGLKLCEPPQVTHLWKIQDTGVDKGGHRYTGVDTSRLNGHRYTGVDTGRLQWTKVDTGRLERVDTRLDTSRLEWIKVDTGSLEWTQVDWSGHRQTGVDTSRLGWTQVDWSGHK